MGWSWRVGPVGPGWFLLLGRLPDTGYSGGSGGAAVLPRGQWRASNYTPTTRVAFQRDIDGQRQVEELEELLRRRRRQASESEVVAALWLLGELGE